MNEIESMRDEVRVTVSEAIAEAAAAMKDGKHDIAAACAAIGAAAGVAWLLAAHQPSAGAAFVADLPAAPAVPEGWVMVPREPTEEMLAAAQEADCEYTLRTFGDVMTVQQGPWDHWTAMIAAAPPPPQQGETQ